MRPARPAPTLRPAAALLCLLAAATPALAEKPKVKVVAAKVGLPPSGRSAERDENLQAVYICKFATWAPLYVRLEILDEMRDLREPLFLVVETPDADGTATSLSIPLPSLADANPGRVLSPAELGPLPYLRPGGTSGETTITVRTARGAVSDPYRMGSPRTRDIRTYVVLALGGRLPGFDLPKVGTGTEPGEGAANASGPLRGGRVELATIDRIDMLPDQWFGYDAADLVVIPTGAASDEFVRRLFGDQGSAADKVKRAALFEWVRRGGRVVVSAGSNAAVLAQLCQPGPDGREPEFQRFLPAAVPLNAPTRSVEQLVADYPSRGNANESLVLTPRAGSFLAANLADRPGRPGWTVSPWPGSHNPGRDRVAVQAPYGLGKVTLIGFDLDRPPFSENTARAAFWDWVLREGGANRASMGSAEEQKTTGPAGDEAEDNLATALRLHVDTFEGVPVISFGWVAVFIVLYIVLIGPVEYVFLKKVLGRLELTWVTFPVIVVTVSAAAYFTAYAIKGRDLKVNKLDVVEVDPASGRVYGTTWFTVFSPRIDTYTVGVTPAEGWTTGADEPGGTLLGWLGARTHGTEGLVRRRYRYHVEPGVVADGLEDVPIRVWATKSFVANWSGPINPASPVVESNLEHPPGAPDKVIGTFVNRMPFPELRDCVAFHGDRAYPIAGGTIVKDQTVRLVFDEGRVARPWLTEGGPDGPAGQLGLIHSRGEPEVGYGPGRPGRQAATDPAARGSTLPLWGFLFYEQSLKNETGSYPRNASLRRLDQSWRLRPENRDEVILVGRVVVPSLPAEEALGGAASPTRVWLKGLPGQGKARQPIPGTARQETYVRVYLPVKPAGAAR